MWLGRAAVSDNSQLEALINGSRHSTEPPPIQTNKQIVIVVSFFILLEFLEGDKLRFEQNLWRAFHKSFNWQAEKAEKTQSESFDKF